MLCDVEMVGTEGAILAVCLLESSVDGCDVEALGELSVESVVLLVLEIWMDEVKLLEGILLASVANKSLVEGTGVASINRDEMVEVVPALDGLVGITMDEVISLNEVLITVVVVATLGRSVEIDADEKISLDDVLIDVEALGGLTVESVVLLVLEIWMDEMKLLEGILLASVTNKSLVEGTGVASINRDEMVEVVPALEGSVGITTDEIISLNEGTPITVVVVAALGSSVEIDADERALLDDIPIVIMVVAALGSSVEIDADERVLLDDIPIVIMVASALGSSVEIDADLKILDDVVMALVAALRSSVETVDVATIKVDERNSLGEVLAAVAVVVIAMGNSLDV